MDDPQHPADGDDGSGQQPRRASLRLRDAETVATTRRDMFGDGSLLTTLAGAPPARGETPNDPQENSAAAPPGSSSDPAPGESAQDQLPAAADGVAETAEAAEDRAKEQADPGPDPHPDPAFAANPASFPFAQLPQSLDSIIDSFAPGPGSEAPEASPSGDEAVPPPLAASASDAGGHPSDRPDLAPPAQMAVSSFFDTLTGEPLQAEAPAEEEPLPEVPGLDMSMLGRPMPQAKPRWSDPEPEPVHGEDAGSREDIGAGDGHIEAATGAEAEASFGADERTAAMAPPANDFDGPPLPEVAGHAFYSEPPSTSGAPPQTLAFPRFPDSPEMPPYLDGPEMQPYPDGPEMPPFLEPLQRSRVPQHLEPPNSLSDPPGAPAFAEPIVSESAAPEPIVSASAPPYSPSEAAAQPMFHATAKIAAEANATAEALDNLKRFFDRDAPDPEAAGYVPAPQAERYAPGPQVDRYAPGLEVDRYVAGLDQPVRRSARDAAPRTLLGNPAQFAVNERAPLMPLPVPPDEGRGNSIYLLGFLTGLGLSVMAGLALYLLITMG